MNNQTLRPTRLAGLGKFSKLAVAAGLVGMLGFSAAASASHRGDDRYDDDRYYNSAPVYAQVISSTPITHRVRVNEPRQECWDERVTYREPRYQGPTAGTLLGGILGGVAGHQFGGGHGRDVATAVGAVIGASIGSANAGYRGDVERTGYEQRCRTVLDSYYEDRIDGYDVTYRYRGQTYQTRLPYDPGRRLAVNVDVSPVRN